MLGTFLIGRCARRAGAATLFCAALIAADAAHAARRGASHAARHGAAHAATSNDPALVEYEIEPGDVKGPFNKSIPTSFEKKAELKNLNYTGPRELLAEKFHIAPALLTRLNPKASFETAEIGRAHV